MKKFAGILLFVIVFVSYSFSQNKTIARAIAYLNYNEEKTISEKGMIVYSASFFVKHIQMDEETKSQHISNVLNSNFPFSELKLVNITENNNLTDKGFMVVIVVKASDKNDLTAKIKYLLQELNILNVNYNNSEYKLTHFKF